MRDSIHILFARHSALRTDQAFLTWLARHGCSVWYDTGFNDAAPRVVVVSTDGSRAWAALENVDLSDGFSKTSVARSADIDLTQIPPAETVVRDALKATSLLRRQVISSKPVVDFRDDGGVDVHWLVELDTGAGGAIKFSHTEGLAKKNRAIDKLADVVRPLAVSDDLATNDLHSPHLFKAEAESWTAGLTSARDKARRIGEKVEQTYRYDKTIPLIDSFTWADWLVRDRNNRAGICDEFSVVQISCLRSIGIPARLKLLSWLSPNGDWDAHACLEFSDAGRWTHMDGLWKAFDFPGVYREQGMRNVTVMDADFPLDARSNLPAWGTPDPPGDGLLHPYEDSVINPPWPGDDRPGYSY